MAEQSADEAADQRYRNAMRHYPAGVTVVTLCADGDPVGFTATSFASLSLRPPLISFNIADTSSSLAAVQAAGSLVVHLLGEHQRHIAQRFSRTAEQRFADRSLWTLLDTGEPMLHGTPVWLRCTVSRLIDLGDHTLVIAEVTRIHNEADEEPAASPLLYHNGRYSRATELD